MAFLKSLGATVFLFIIFMFMDYLIFLRRKNDKGSIGYQLLVSFGFLCIYLCLWIYIVLMNLNQEIVLNDLNTYLVCCAIGIISTFWCYFEIDEELKWKIKMKDNQLFKMKKLIVCLFLAGFTFYHGYWQFKEVLYEQEIDLFMATINTTVILTVGVLDQVLSQIRSVLHNEKENKKDIETL